MKFDPKMIDDNNYIMYKGSVYKKDECNIEENNNIFFKLLKHTVFLMTLLFMSILNVGSVTL